jgi:ribonucleoside-diphosphate reductase alpha chain
MKHGMAHAYRLAIAPTGSISYIQNATASILPIVERIEVRTYGDSTTIYPMPFLDAMTYYYYKPAYDMSMFKMIDMVAVVQDHVDQGISCTLFVKSNETTADLSRYYIYAHKKGLKSLYYTRTKLLTIAECESCAV